MFTEADYHHLYERYLVSVNSRVSDGGSASSVSMDPHDIEVLSTKGEGFTTAQKKVLIKYDLKEILLGLAKHLFGAQSKVTWREDFFPFTEPSFELDVLFATEKTGVDSIENNSESGTSNVLVDSNSEQNNEEGKWLEVLGCGIIHDDVMENARKKVLNSNSTNSSSSSLVVINEHGWAFGLGLERLAMILFSIPDIRLFW